MYLASLDSAEVRRLVDADQAVLHVPSSELLFIRERTLFAQPFDVRRLDLTGSPSAVTTQGDASVVGVSVSDAGPIAFRSVSTGDLLRQFAWFDRSGRELEKVGDPSARFNSPSLSPDGRYVAGYRRDKQLDIWLLDLNRVVLSRFTLTDDRDEVNPVWSPDGKRIVFLSRGGSSAADLYQKSVTGAGKEEPLLVTDQDKNPSDWSPDGRFLLYENSDPTRPGSKWGDIWALPMGGKPFPVVQTPAQEAHGQFSPDGKWIAFESNESGRNEIYLQQFPRPGLKTLVSTSGGGQARWRRDGKELFYISLDGRLMAVPIQLPSGDEMVKISSPVPLFAAPMLRGAQSALPAQYVVDRDGQRFLMGSLVQDGSAPPITVILNWKGRP